VTLFLVTTGRATGAELDPAGFDDVWALRDRLPQGAAWFSAPEAVAVATCQLLTEADAGVLTALRAPQPGEGDAAFGERVTGTVRLLLQEEAGRDVVLIGHREAWVVLAADAAAALGTPDVLALSDGLGSAG
jgi:nucleoid-associated protein YgaU